MCKSPNKHNRITAKAEPLEDDLPEAIEKGDITPGMDPKVRAKLMHEDFGWEKENAGTKLWDFGPENTGPNLLVDATKGV